MRADSRAHAMQSHTDSAVDRFLTLARELRRTGNRLDDWAVLRHAAVTLPFVQIDPLKLAGRFRVAVRELDDATRWWHAANGSVRYAIAASLVRQEESAAAFLAELQRVQALFRSAKLPRASLSEIQAFITLREDAPHGRPTAAQVERMRELFAEIRKDHRWLLGAGEYPTVALLAQTDAPASEIARRVEAMLVRLEERGFGARGRLMPASQMLFFAHDADAVVCGRFEALWSAFKERGLRMGAGDYEEVALLTYLPRPAGEVARTVLSHRAELETLRPRPGREIGFSLGCSTAFAEIVGADKKLQRLALTQSSIQVRMLIAARTAAAAAAAS
jgi:hypothetical protein